MTVYISVLCDLFAKADTSCDGKVSLEEFVIMCEEFGVELSKEEVEGFTSISDPNGEVAIRNAKLIK